MNKFLLASMALALASGPASAQLQMKSVAPVTTVKKSNLFPQGNIKLSNKPVFSSRETRGEEDDRILLKDVELSPKSLLNMGGWDRNVYPAGLKCESNMTIHIGTFYDPALLARYDGNKLSTIKTVIGPNMKNLKAYILDAQTGDVVWEGKQLPGFNNTTGKAKVIKFPCDYTLDKNTPIVVVYQVTTKSSEAVFSVVNNVVGSGFLLDVEGDQANGFQDIGAVNGIAAYIECITEGEAGLKANDVTVLDVAGGRVLANGEYSTVATFMNYGTNPVSKISTSYIVNEKEVKEEVGSQDAFPYMAPVQVQVKATSPAEASRFLQNFSIETVNGVADEYMEADVFTKKPDNVAQNILTVMSKEYPRTVVMEQFTGTWCGWCPRGHVAMEKAAKACPEQFIGIAVHAGDEMETKEYGPLVGMTGGSFPSAMLSRIGYSVVDPYYGSQGPSNDPQQSGDIVNDIKAIAAMPVEATADLSCSLNGESVDVASAFNFSLSVDGAYYSVAYVLLENGIKGYLQSNYYGRGGGVFQSADQIAEEDLRFLFNEGKNGKYMPTFNHVARSIKDVGGIQGVLDDVKIEQGVKVTHNYNIPLPENVANKENLEVVVMLLDNFTGEIVTAKKVKIGDATAIENVTADVAEVVVANGAINVNGNGVVSLYTVDGKLVKSVDVNGSAVVSTAGLKGAYVVRVVNGSHVTVKKVML